MLQNEMLVSMPAKSHQLYCKQDRADWFHDMLKHGDWGTVQQFRKHKSCDYVKLHSHNGVTLDADQRAEGLAEHLENVQWTRRAGTISSQDPPIFDFMHISCSVFNEVELHAILCKLKKRKA